MYQVPYGNWSTTGYNDYELNAAGKAAVDFTGVSKFSIRNPEYDVAVSQPTNTGTPQVTSVRFRQADFGAATMPKLVIEWEIPAPPAGEELLPPSTLTATDLGGTSVNITWTPDGEATHTHVMIGRGEYATTVNQTGFELVYQGTDNETVLDGLALEITDYRFSAWGANTTDLSAEYITATIGGDSMDDIALSLGHFLQLGVVALFVILAFLFRSRALFVIASVACIIFGFTIYDVSEGLSFLMGAFGFVMFVLAWVTRGIRT